MKTTDECIAEAQQALSKAFRVTEANAEAAHHYTQIAHAWLQVARDLALRTEVPA